MTTDPDVRRKTQADVAFDEGMDDAIVDELVAAPAFETLDPKYRKSPGFRKTLRTGFRNLT